MFTSYVSRLVSGSSKYSNLTFESEAHTKVKRSFFFGRGTNDGMLFFLKNQEADLGLKKILKILPESEIDAESTSKKTIKKIEQTFFGWTKLGNDLRGVILEYLEPGYLDVLYVLSKDEYSGIQYLPDAIKKQQQFRLTKAVSTSFKYPVSERFTHTAVDCLVIDNVAELESVFPFFPNVKAIKLQDKSCSSLAFLKNFPKIRSLDIRDCNHVSDFSPISELSELEEINLSDNWHIENLDFLRHCKKLKTIDSSKCEQLKDASALSCCLELTSIDFQGCRNISSISFLENCKKLTFLNLSKCTTLQNFEAIRHCLFLKVLNLSGCKTLEKLDFLAFLAWLESLDISNCWRIQNISFSPPIDSLISLNLADCWQIEILEALGAPNIQNLNVSGCQKLSDFGFLRHHPHVQFFDLGKHKAIVDFLFLELLKGSSKIVLPSRYKQAINNFYATRPDSDSQLKKITFLAS